MSTGTEQTAGQDHGGEALAAPRPHTTLPDRTRRPARRPQPRQVSVLRAGDVLSVVGALAAAVCTAALLWTQIGFFSGIIGYVIVTWCLFIGFYTALVSIEDNGPATRDKVAAVVVQ